MSQEKIKQVQIVDDERIAGFFGEYRWLSNFHLVDIKDDGLTYPSTENMYQAYKLVDLKEREKFVNITPSEAKKLGKIITLREDWEQIKDFVMIRVNSLKYLRCPDLRKKLLDTGDRYLEETNWWGDTYWGVCNGVGENILGKILMCIREGVNEDREVIKMYDNLRET